MPRRKSRGRSKKKGGSISAAVLGLASFGLGAPAGASGYYLYKTRSTGTGSAPLPPPRDDGGLSIPPISPLPPTLPSIASPPTFPEGQPLQPPLQSEFDALMAKIGLTEADLLDEQVCQEKINNAPINRLEKKTLCDGIYQCYFNENGDECKSQSGAISSRGRIRSKIGGTRRQRKTRRTRRRRTRSTRRTRRTRRRPTKRRTR